MQPKRLSSVLYFLSTMQRQFIKATVCFIAWIAVSMSTGIISVSIFLPQEGILIVVSFIINLYFAKGQTVFQWETLDVTVITKWLITKYRSIYEKQPVTTEAKYLQQATESIFLAINPVNPDYILLAINPLFQHYHPWHSNHDIIIIHSEQSRHECIRFNFGSKSIISDRQPSFFTICDNSTNQSSFELSCKSLFLKFIKNLQ